MSLSDSQNAESPQQLKVLYVVMKHDYGVPEQGLSYEHMNFYGSLIQMGCEVLYFDFATLSKAHGRTRMNERLREVVDEERPDILFCVLHKNEIDRETMRRITEETDTLTFNWFCDDLFRFQKYSSRWARCFDWIVTVDPQVVPDYLRLGARHAEYVRWAYNPELYQHTEHQTFDVTFVGQPHGKRRQAIAALRAEGVNVQTWGRGWENGRLSQEEMAKVFTGSRINLNFSRASVPLNPRSILPKRYPKQVKGRLVEVPACGGFLLTEDAPLLRDYFAPGQHVAIFHSTKELVSKVRYYLNHPEERKAIAKEGYKHVLANHTYIHRFTDIFTRMGFLLPSVEQVLQKEVQPGITRDITITVDTPLVSVVTSVYNGARFLRATLDSILAQNFHDWEFIIIDDGSTDETPQIIAEYAARDSRIITKRLEHAGKVTGFNTGFAMARGELIAVTGADDISLPHRLSAELNFLLEHPKIAAVGSWVDLIDAEGKVFGILKHPFHAALLRWLLFFRNPMAACSTMFRRSCGAEIGWYRETGSEDHDFLSRLCDRYDLANVQSVLAQYRIWNGNFTSLHSNQEEATIIACLQERGGQVLGEPISQTTAEALRMPIVGTTSMTLSQIRSAASLCRRLYHAHRRSCQFSFLEAQLLRDHVSEYFVLLARKARHLSFVASVWFSAYAVLMNPLFVRKILLDRRKK